MSCLGARLGQKRLCLSAGPGVQVTGAQPRAVSGCSLLTRVQWRPAVRLTFSWPRGFVLGAGPRCWGVPWHLCFPCCPKSRIWAAPEQMAPSRLLLAGGVGRWPGKSLAPAPGTQGRRRLAAWLKEAARWEASLGADLVPVASGPPLWGGPGLFLGTAARRHQSCPPAGP